MLVGGRIVDNAWWVVALVGNAVWVVVLVDNAVWVVGHDQFISANRWCNFSSLFKIVLLLVNHTFIRVERNFYTEYTSVRLVYSSLLPNCSSIAFIIIANANIMLFSNIIIIFL